MGSISGGSIGYAYPLEEESSSSSHYQDSERSLADQNNVERNNNNTKSIYELAQQSSSRQVGSTLYNTGNNFGRRRPNRALRFQNNNNATTNAHYHYDNQARSSMASTITSFRQNSIIAQQSSTIQIITSMSGNPLTLIDRNDLPEELELDKDELKKMIIHSDGEDGSANNDTRNTDATSEAQSTKKTDPSESIITPMAPPTSVNNPTLLKLSQSEHIRRSLFLITLLTLMAIGTFFTVENIIHVKDANAWIEPTSSNMGIHWSTFQNDQNAPQPIIGANNLPPMIQDHIADWTVGTTYLPGIVDSYGSIALSDATRFRDVPLFWGSEYADFQGRGGGNSILEGVLGCLNFVQVSSEGVLLESSGDSSKVGSGGGGGGSDGMVERPKGDYLNLHVVLAMGRKYLNVDTTTIDGIERAKVLALGSSGMADVIYSSLLQDVSSLFTTLNQGRMFVLIRHPVEREMARFRYLRRGQFARTKLNDWQRGNLQDMSYVEYAKSEFARDNWMTRELVNKRCIDGKGEDGNVCDSLEERDLYTAKEILRRKALIGLYSDIMGAVQHYGRYFRWDGAQEGKRFDDSTMYCFQNHVLEGMRKDALGGKDLDPNDALEHSDAYVALMEKNSFDFELFTYAQTLYKYQVELS